MKRFAILLAAFLSLSILAGCSSTTTGALQIAFAGVPAGVSGDVVVSGPDGFSQRVSDDESISGLAPGTYTVSAFPVLGQEPIVPFVYAPAAPSMDLSVSAGQTAKATVTYAKRPGSGRLWQPADGAPLLAGFAPDVLDVSGAPTPTVSIGGSSTPLYESVVFDAHGNAWVSVAFGSTTGLLKFLAGDLESSGSPAPAVILTGDGGSPESLTDPIGMAFDADGNLWVGAYGFSRLEMYTPAQLAASGSPTPAVVIDGPSVDGPIGLAFDASGNLWVANQFGPTVVAFTPSQLSAGGLPVAAITIAADGFGSLALPKGVAFDASGNLWVANQANSTVVRFAPGQLTGSGTPTPVATIEAATFADGGPTSVSFDHDGNLWVGHSGTNESLSRIDNPGALSLTVTPSVAATVDVAYTYDVGIPAFSPVPPDLPIIAP